MRKDDKGTAFVFITDSSSDGQNTQSEGEDNLQAGHGATPGWGSSPPNKASIKIKRVMICCWWKVSSLQFVIKHTCEAQEL